MKYDEVVPEDLILHFQKTIPGFKEEDYKHQWALAKMAWQGSAKQREHRHFDGAMSFPYQELETCFGRSGFGLINARVAFFSVTKSWSKDKQFTRGFKFSELVQKTIEKYLDSKWSKVTRMLTADNKPRKGLGRAISSRDMNNSTTDRWPKDTGLNKIIVDVHGLESLRKWLRRIRDEYRRGHVPTAGLFSRINSIEPVERWLAGTSKVIRIATADSADYGVLPQRYVEAASGRLYAVGVNLQTAPTLVKQAALAGQWEYDFANCHFAILMHLSEKFGYTCHAVKNYLANKRQVRSQIAQSADISQTAAKKCLLAAIYGARQSLREEDAIPKEIGKERAKLLYQDPLFMAIKEDIDQARTQILKKSPKTPNGRLINAFGKACPGGANTAERLAHLTQGIEAQALRATVELYPSEIVLLQHDGFVARRQLDKVALIEAVHRATGIPFDVEERMVQVDPDAQFEKSQANRMQSEIGR